MAQAKGRPEQKKPRKKNSMVILNNLPDQEGKGSEGTEPESIWKEEVEGLIGEKFTSLPAVIDAIAGRVCQRLGEEEGSSLHEFIVMMLDTDDEIREELREVFGLK